MADEQARMSNYLAEDIVGNIDEVRTARGTYDTLDDRLDNIEGGSPSPSSDTPAMDGTGSAGTADTYARGDHVHPTDTSRQAALDTNQMAAVNSGITSTDVEQIQFNKNNILAYGGILATNGAKNRLPFKIADIKSQNTGGTWSGNSYTFNGVTFDVSADGTVSVNGTATGGNAAFVISPTEKFTIEPGEWVLSGCPSGGSTSTYNISIAGTASDTGNSVEFSGCTAQFVRIYVLNGATANNLVFKPMVCSKAEWDISHQYAPYAPTNRELYEMILELQR